MRNLRAIFDLVALIVMFCWPSHAVTEYVLVNNNNSVANTAILYRLSSTTGHLSKISMFDTGGQGEGLEDDLSGVQLAVSENAGCIFVLDTGSSDIAAFSKATGYKRVGSYFAPNLISDGEGDSIALSPNNRFLYASYTRTGNLGAWKVNSDCALTPITRSGSLTGVGPLRVTPNGKYFLARGLGGVTEFAIDKLSGNITEIGVTSFRTGACQRESACLPYGIEITRDSKFAVFASFAPDIRRQHTIPLVLTAQITSTGLANPRVWGLKGYGNLRFNDFPFFSAAGYAGNGNLYFGVHSGGSYSAGVLTTAFTEKPMKFTVTDATVVGPEVANITVTGNLMVIAQYPNQIGVFRIQKDGSLKLLSTTTIDDQGEGLFSLSIFPSTR
jgi:hypothetical protein